MTKELTPHIMEEKLCFSRHPELGFLVPGEKFLLSIQCSFSSSCFWGYAGETWTWLFDGASHVPSTSFLYPKPNDYVRGSLEPVRANSKFSGNFGWRCLILLCLQKNSVYAPISEKLNGLFSVRCRAVDRYYFCHFSFYLEKILTAYQGLFL